MAKSHRSTSIPAQNDSKKSLHKTKTQRISALREIFDRDDEDPKGYLLTWAEAVAHDGGIDLLSFLPRVLYWFLKEQGSDFTDDPQKYRVPTEEEDEINMMIISTIQYLDPDPDPDFR
jgi:hypothetical protein